MICKNKLNKNMDALGFRESMPGTEMVRMAVGIVDRERTAMMCKEIYPGIAKATGRTPAAVERGMRTAIEAAMRSPAWESAWREMGGWGRPTNSEVIRRLARDSNAD